MQTKIGHEEAIIERENEYLRWFDDVSRRMKKRLGDMGSNTRPEDYAKLAENNGAFDETKLRGLLSAQLKTPWNGVDGFIDLPAYMKILFALLALKGASDEDLDPLHASTGVRRLYGHLVFDLWDRSRQGDASDPTYGLENAYEEIEKTQIMRSPKITEAAFAIAGRHAYAETAFLSLLSAARDRNGVVAVADFGWLKTIDPSLWFAMNDVRSAGVLFAKEPIEMDDRRRDEKTGIVTLVYPKGPQVFHPEGAGICAHWVAEIGAGAPIVKPEIEPAHREIFNRYRENVSNHLNPLSPDADEKIRNLL